ncbi:MAG: hypothetical protein ISR76_02290 [Planctomycetes bacterium]|nr:hypothetical protein [Planctomycetota bacterium]MBL7007798.1 hypothetical protein [Planctomycetota bacterium]
MALPTLDFSPGSSFDPAERGTLLALGTALAESNHPQAASLLGVLVESISRVDQVGYALQAYPPTFGERTLGGRQRGRGTLVDLLGNAQDASVELYVPTRAVVGRTLVVAELNAWRLASYIYDEVLGAGGQHTVIDEEIDHWLHGCVYSLLAEDILRSVAIDTSMERRIREKAVDSLSLMWESRHTLGARHFFPLLAETWAARRRIRVSVGTLLGVSEIFRLLQAGGDPEFVSYFARQKLTLDEEQAFQEFLIGVSTEEIHSLYQLIADTGKTSLSPEEARVRNRSFAGGGDVHECVRFYEFFRARHLAAVARRIKDLPGPKKTAEEYVMIYFLDQQDQPPPGPAVPL